MRFHRFFILGVLALLLSDALAPAKDAPVGAALDLNGAPVDPISSKNLATVLIFISVDCPISNRYAPQIQRLQARFATNRIPIWLVYPDPEVSPGTVRQHLKDYRYLDNHVVLDPRHALVKRAKAKITPEAAVFSSDGKLLYHGRIDNRFPELGQARPEATTHELEEALTSLSEGREVPTRYEAPVGCFIPD